MPEKNQRRKSSKHVLSLTDSEANHLKALRLRQEEETKKVTQDRNLSESGTLIGVTPHKVQITLRRELKVNLKFNTVCKNLRDLAFYQLIDIVPGPKTNRRASRGRPPRKYYSIAPKGLDSLEFYEEKKKILQNNQVDVNKPALSPG